MLRNRKRYLVRILAAVVVWAIPAIMVGAEPAKMLELQIGKSKYTGKIVAKDAEDIWLLERDGRMQPFAIRDVTNYKPLAGAFRGYSMSDVRDQLVKEFGREYEVVGSAHYLVVGGRGRPRQYLTKFEELYRHLQVYLAARGFRIHEPEYPLIAVVFPDRSGFVDYCLKEKVKPSAGLRGYYLQGSNRVALYDTAESADVDDTIIHEAVHQVAYNFGLHQRIGETPLWVAEGLATTMEPENFRNGTSTMPLSAKINRSRYVQFRNYLAERRPANSLEDFVKSDHLFKSATLDGYAQAWALTFFLLETRQQQYSQYLKTLSARSPLETYEEEDRLKDFRKAFGKNTTQLEAEFLRFLGRITN